MSAVHELSTNPIEPSTTSHRAQAYVALLGMVVSQLEPPTFGLCIEDWARFMAASGIGDAACVSALRLFRDEIPLLSLAQACITLDIDVREVLGDGE